MPSIIIFGTLKNKLVLFSNNNSVAKSVNQTHRKYTTGFTAGNLLLDESLLLLRFLEHPNDLFLDRNLPPHTIMPSGSEASQKRIFREVVGRLRALKSSDLLNLLQNGSPNVQKLIMLYATAAQYPIIADFMLTSIRPKWMHMDFELTSYDFKAFFYRLLDTHPYLEEVSQEALTKLSSLILRIFREAGYMQEQNIVKMQADHDVIKAILKNGDLWFLDAMLLNENEKEEYLT